jgi:hypothetical protein
MGRPKKEVEDELVDEVAEVVETDEVTDEVAEVVPKVKLCPNCENSGAECYLCGGYKPNVKKSRNGVCSNCDNSGLDCYLCGGYKG